MRKHVKTIWSRVRHSKKPSLIYLVAFLLGSIVVFQLLYPSDRLLPSTTIAGISYSGWTKSDVIEVLDDKYSNQVVPIYFGGAEEPYLTPLPSHIGLNVSHDEINSVNYPWYLRIIPTSFLWANNFISTDYNLKYNRNNTKLDEYIESNFGNVCYVEPQDANIDLSDDVFEYTPAFDGFSCNTEELKSILSNTIPELNNDYSVSIPAEDIYPSIGDIYVRKMAINLQNNLSTGVPIYIDDITKSIPVNELYEWMKFDVKDNQLSYSFIQDRAESYLINEFFELTAIEPGVTIIDMLDFSETSRTDGVDGRKIDIINTISSLRNYLDGDIKEAVIATSIIEPGSKYERTYSKDDDELSAVIKQFAEDHSGFYGVSMIEMTNDYRRASYNSDEAFITASTYKLFVAYSTLKRIESGAWSWSDQITPGRNLSVCFDDMIKNSDNECAVAMLLKISYQEVTNEAREIGCNDTVFNINTDIESTSFDISLFLAQLYKGQILTQQSSRDKLIDAMKLNVYRSGIPTGLNDIIVADKVGFLWDLLHDASIIYSPTGDYILVILTNQSSWANIAELAKQIEEIRTQ